MNDYFIFALLAIKSAKLKRRKATLVKFTLMKENARVCKILDFETIHEKITVIGTTTMGFKKKLFGKFLIYKLHLNAIDGEKL